MREEEKIMFSIGFGVGMLLMYLAYAIENLDVPPFAVMLLISGYAIFSFFYCGW